MKQKTTKAKTKKHKIKLKAGINICTALMGIPRPVTDEDVYYVLASKLGATKC